MGWFCYFSKDLYTLLHYSLENLFNKFEMQSELYPKYSYFNFSFYLYSLYGFLPILIDLILLF